MSCPRLRFGKADIVVLDGRRLEVRRDGVDDVEFVSTDCERERIEKSHADLRKAYFERRLIVERGVASRLPAGLKTALEKPLDCFSPEGRATAMQRLEYVNLCERMLGERRVPKTLEGYARVGRVAAWLRRASAAQAAGCRRRSLPLERFGASTIRGWHWRWRDAGRSVNALVPLDYMKGSKTPTIDASASAVIEHHVRDEWLTTTRPPLTVVHENIVAEITMFNANRQSVGAKLVDAIPVPSLSTVARWVERNVDDYDAVLARYGRKEAERRFKGVRRAPQPIRPLQIVEVDHTLLDIMVIDPTSPSGVSRPWLTAAICATTRMLYGFHIGFEAPSWSSVMACLHMGALPKDKVLVRWKHDRYDFRSEWPVFGLPEVLVVDNGKDFQSNSLKAAAGQLGFELRYTPARRPHLKGKIERYFGEIARNFLAFLPGRTFSNVQQRGDYDSAAAARLSLDELIQAFLIWTVDYYHNKAHRGLALASPSQRWKDLSAYGVRVTPDVSELTAFLGLVLDRSIRSIGVEYLGLVYQSKELQLLRRGPGKTKRKWTVKADPFDLSEISVLDEDGNRWLKVPSVDPDLTDGLNIRQYKEILDEAKALAEGGSRVTVSNLLDARRMLMEIGREKGVRAASRPTEVDVHWFRTNIDRPIVRVADSASRRRLNKADRRRADNRARVAVSTENVQSPPGDGNTSDLHHLFPASRPAEVITPTKASVAGGRRPRIDPNDPKNWK